MTKVGISHPKISTLIEILEVQVSGCKRIQRASTGPGSKTVAMSPFDLVPDKTAGDMGLHEISSELEVALNDVTLDRVLVDDPTISKP